MVRIYDENMTEVHLPKDYGLHYGSYPLDLEIGSFEYETIGRKDVPSGRSALFRGMIIANNLTDIELKTERVYQFFRTLGTFFVAKESSPFKLLKVKVTEPYTIGVGNGALVDYEIPLNVQAPYFKQSLHSTLDIDSEGILFNDKWAYGMGLSTNENQWKYSFSNENPRFYNAGTEDIKLIRQKESEIKLTFKGPAVNGLLDIDDSSTTFKIWEDFKAGDVLIIKGDKVTLNGNNVLGDTNFEFLTVKKGWNDWDIRGLNGQFDFEIDFRFLYD